MRTGRPWLAFVLILFCLPLFVGLGGADLETDEAIYSFAVDRILEIGDWLEPKSSPSESDVFLEKPPLKFWIVAAPIRAGLLPHNEFGLRFWDAVAGGLSFLYLYMIGSILAGPVSGGVAVLLLFVHGPLLFKHGLRTNNMEAALLLAYCGAVYHFLCWAKAESPRARCGHAAAAGLYFVLGFMTKFVAAVFLPLIIGLCAVAVSDYRAKLIRDWRVWGGVAALVLVLVLPWFVYAQVRFGRLLWDTMIGEHVLVRFTGSLDPEHRQPWNFYFVSIYREFGSAAWLVIAGLVTLLVQAIGRRWPDGALILVWATLPVTLISFGTSKLYHYAYPFLPPLALAGGYLAALFVMLAPVPLRNALEWVEDRIASVARLNVLSGRRWLMRLLQLAIVSAAALAVVGAVSGRVRLTFPGGAVLSSSGILRPILAIAALGILARASARVSQLVVAIVVLSVLPIGAYYETLKELHQAKHPLRTTSQCVQRIQETSGTPAGLYVNVPEDSFWHPLYYYFRRIRPWNRSPAESADALNRYLYDPASWRPILIAEDYYRRFIHADESGARPAGTSPPMMTAFNAIVLLPGPYAACSPEAALRALGSTRQTKPDEAGRGSVLLFQQ
jgi:4-amino-4-deoxy-L-arabinose transferase-like glycosyltransferase